MNGLKFRGTGRVKLNGTELLKGTLALLVIDVLVDPTNLLFHLKYLLFGLVFLIWLAKPRLGQSRFTLPPLPAAIIGFVAFVMPAYALSVGLINSTLNVYDLGTWAYFNAFFFFLLLIVILREQIDLTHWLNRGALLIVAITLTFYGILLLNPGFFEILYHYFVLEKGTVVYALRNYGDFTLLMIFYKTSPILVFPLSYLLYRLFIARVYKGALWKVVSLLLITVTLFLSGTRANVLSLIAILLFYGGWMLFRASRKGFVLALILSGMGVMMIVPWIAALLFNSGETSNVMKLGHFTSYLDHFEQHPLMVLFGQGIGGSFFTSGLNRMSNVSELTYLEIIRIWGVVLALVFVLILLVPLYHELRTRRITSLFIAYAAYLMIAGTNPLLLSSTGMIVLVYVFANTFSNRTGDENRDLAPHL